MDDLSEGNGKFAMNLLKKLCANNSENVFFHPWASSQPWQTWGRREPQLPKWHRYLKPFPETINTTMNLSIYITFYISNPKEMVMHAQLCYRHRDEDGHLLDTDTGQPFFVACAPSCGYCSRQLDESCLSLWPLCWLTAGASVLLHEIRKSFHSSITLLCGLS
jgi:hypothetical protein